jgi:hypothetical protein
MKNHEKLEAFLETLSHDDKLDAINRLIGRCVDDIPKPSFDQAIEIIKRGIEQRRSLAKQR